MDKPVGILSTKYGDISYRVHSGTLVSLRTDGADNESDHQSLVLRNIPYRVTMELRLQGNGVWDSNGEHKYFDRRDTYGKDPSYSAKGTLTEEMTRVWTEYVQHRPSLLDAGRRAEWEADVERKQNEVEKAREVLDSRTAELDTLMREEPMMPLSNITS